MVMQFDGGRSSGRNIRAPRPQSRITAPAPAPSPSPQRAASPRNFTGGGRVRGSSRPGSLRDTAPAPRTAPAPAPAPAARTTSFNDVIGGTDVGFNEGFGGMGGGGGVEGAPGAPTPPPLSDEDWLKQGGDSIYAEQLAALKKAMEDYKAEQGVQRGRYNTDFEEGSRRLGWKDRDGFEGAEDPGQWDFEDTNFAAGRGFKSQRDDFAARGLLQSSDYGDARTMLERNLNDQRASMLTDRNRFTDDLAAQLAAFQSENTNAQGSARQEALLRRASGLIAQ